MTMRHRVNSPNVIHETIEGEVILIDLKTGTYYSLRGVGAAIWQGIVADAGSDEIADDLRRRYNASDEQVADAVQTLIGELEREGLIRSDAAGGEAAKLPTPEDGGGAPPVRAAVTREAHRHAGSDPARPGARGRRRGLASP